MALAQMLASGLSMTVLHAGEMICTQPSVHHNVYLPGHAVIHTVKHGTARHGTRIGTPRSRVTRPLSSWMNRAFTSLLHAWIANRRWSAMSRKPDGAPERKYAAPAQWPATYSDDYRHFDNLIWQTPAWTTAVFSAFVAGLFYLFSLDSTSAARVSTAAGVSVDTLVYALLASAVLFFSAAYYALFRWRVHQRYTCRSHVPRPMRDWMGAQLPLQLVVGGQAIFVLSLILSKSLPPALSAHGELWVAMAGTLLAITWSTEHQLNHRKKDAQLLSDASRLQVASPSPQVETRRNAKQRAHSPGKA